MISWCLSNRDSAMTDRRPPGRTSFAMVTRSCAARRSKSRIVEPGYQGYRSAQDCPYTVSHATIDEFAPHSHTRATIMCDTPSCSPNLRVLQ